LLTLEFGQFGGKLVSDLDNPLVAIPPEKEALEVVVEHPDGEDGHEGKQVKVPEDEGRQQEDRSPLVDCHLLSGPPAVAQVHVDYVQVLFLEVPLVESEVAQESRVVDVDIGIGWVLEKRTDPFVLVGDGAQQLR
jgi:hypothetical protein